MTRTEARRRRRTRRLAIVAAAGVACATVLSFAPAGAGGNSGNEDENTEAFATIGKIYSETVEIKKKNADDFTSADVGDELKVGDTVRTDATGRVRIDYDDESFTRLDFDTTFKINKLADDAGNRQVEGSLEDGNAWHRTAELTESESFEQSGAGATAAVVGTAFAVECDSPTHCVFVAVVDGIRQTGTGGDVNLLDPNDVCDATAGALCDEVTTRSIAEMIADLWVQYNLWLDWYEFGLEPGPFGSFGGTLVVEDGVIVSLTLNPGTPGSPSSPGSPGGIPGVINPTNGILCDGGCSSVSGGEVLAIPPGFVPVPGNSITVGNFDSVDFVVNFTFTPSPFSVVFTDLPDEIGSLTWDTGEGPATVELDTPYGWDTLFSFFGNSGPGGTVNMVFHAEFAGAVSTDSTVSVTLVETCFPSCGELAVAESVAADDPAPAAEPPAAEPPPATEPEPPPAPVDEPPAE